jgi:hypothetical protein
VGKVASGCEIKAAYKQRAMAWHPDKHDSAELKERAEEQFKLLGEALAVLGEPLAKQCVRPCPLCCPLPALQLASHAHAGVSRFTCTVDMNARDGIPAVTRMTLRCLAHAVLPRMGCTVHAGVERCGMGISRLYDEGHDKAAIEERLQAAERAARENPNDRHRRHGGGGCSS